MPEDFAAQSRGSDAYSAGQADNLAVLCVFGTRPELIKFYPVLRELSRRPGTRGVSVLTSQHTDLVRPLLSLWDIEVDYDLRAMVPGQSINELLGRLISRIDPVIAKEQPDLVLVQGDTATALAAAMAAWNRRVPVGHIEAGLRSGLRDTPFPEEMNRRLITSMTSLHFAPTRRNVDTLLAEGVPADHIVRTGNPVVDAVRLIHGQVKPSAPTLALLERLAGKRVILLTTHRRESFGGIMRDRLRTLRRFVETRADVHVVFPVHANPEVRACAVRELGGADRIHLVDPLTYPDFLHCLSASWLAVSDSGGVQEEAPSLGTPLLIVRGNTERPEAVEAGVARLVSDDPDALWRELLEAEAPGSWATRVRPVANPFGQGDSARRIVDTIAARFQRAAGHADADPCTPAAEVS